MRNLLLILLVFISLVAKGQAERVAGKIAADRFEAYYNHSAYDSIFYMFSADMQTALPFNQTSQFLKGLKAQAGNITQRTFIKYESSYASYKTNFEHALFAVNISVDDKGKINGLLVRPLKPEGLPTPERNKTKLILPFRGTWTVAWGGDTKTQNYHVDDEAQKNAFDLFMLDKKGSSYRGDGKKNEDYYAFGKDIIAPCDGEVVTVIDGVKDNVPGEMNPFNVGGNMVVLKTANNEYLLFCHLQHHSVKVQEGQKVKQGQALGLCGNTGNSSEPHLHFHIQNVEDINKATGIKCYFDKIYVDGKARDDYSPVKDEQVSNER